MAVYKVSYRSGSILFYFDCLGTHVGNSIDLQLPCLDFFVVRKQSVLLLIQLQYTILIQMLSVAAIVMSTAMEFRCKCCESVNLTGGWGILDMHQCSWWAVMELADSKCGEAAAAVYLLR